MNKWKLLWPLLLLFSLVLFCCACGVNPTATIEGLIPLVSAILGIAGTTAETILPAESSLIQVAVTLVTNGLGTLLTTLKTYDANKSASGAFAAVQDAFNAVHSNVQQLLTACQVKNPATTTKLTAVVNSVTQVLSTLEAYLVSKQPTVS